MLISEYINLIKFSLKLLVSIDILIVSKYEVDVTYKEWHHAYLGVFLITLGLLIVFIGVFVGPWAIFIGAFLTLSGFYIYIDDLYQHIRQKREPTYSSPLHNLNSYLSSKYLFIRRLNNFMNRLF